VLADFHGQEPLLILINIEQPYILSRDTFYQCQGLNGIFVRLPTARD